MSNLSQPIILTIKSNRPNGDQRDTIELFNAIERGFDFDKNIHPFIEVKSALPGITYQRICRNLAGCDANVTGYEIDRVYIALQKGDWPEENVDQFTKTDEPMHGGCILCINGKSINGNSYQRIHRIGVKRNQEQKNIAEECFSFFLSNDTILTINNIRSGSEMQIFFYASKIYTIVKQNVSGHAIE